MINDDYFRDSLVSHLAAWSEIRCHTLYKRTRFEIPRLLADVAREGVRVRSQRSSKEGMKEVK